MSLVCRWGDLMIWGMCVWSPHREGADVVQSNGHDCYDTRGSLPEYDSIIRLMVVFQEALAVLAPNQIASLRSQ